MDMPFPDPDDQNQPLPSTIPALQSPRPSIQPAPPLIKYTPTPSPVTSSPDDPRKPADRTYFIINRVESARGERLAITFDGERKSTIVTPFRYSENQKWVVVTEGPDRRVQHIIPRSRVDLECAWGAVLPRGNYVWIIRWNDSEGYTIKDGGETALWGIDSPPGSGGQTVTITADKQDLSQRWTLLQG